MSAAAAAGRLAAALDLVKVLRAQLDAALAEAGAAADELAAEIARER